MLIYVASDSKWSLGVNKTNMLAMYLLYATGLNSGGEFSSQSSW